MLCCAVFQVAAEARRAAARRAWHVAQMAVLLASSRARVRRHSTGLDDKPATKPGAKPVRGDAQDGGSGVKAAEASSTAALLQLAAERCLSALEELKRIEQQARDDVSVGNWALLPGGDSL